MFQILFVFAALFTNAAEACDDIARAHTHQGGRVVYAVGGGTVVGTGVRIGTGRMSPPVQYDVTGRRFPTGGNGLHVHTDGGRIHLHSGGGVRVRGGFGYGARTNLGCTSPRCVSQRARLRHAGNTGAAVVYNGQTYQYWYPAQQQVMTAPVVVSGQQAVVQGGVQYAAAAPQYDTGALTMQAVDVYLGQEPRPHRKLESGVCWADEKPEGWDRLPEVRKMRIDNGSDQFLSLSTVMRVSEDNRAVDGDIISMVVVGNKSDIGYHLPLQVSPGVTALAPGQSCYGVLPKHNSREPMWSVTATRFDAEAALGNWWLSESEGFYFYGHYDERNHVITETRLAFSGKADDKHAIDRGQDTTVFAWRDNDFR